jgi:DNA polymerase-1
MQHILFSKEEYNNYDIAILTKTSSFNKIEIFDNYIYPLNDLGVESSNFIGFDLPVDIKGKCSIKKAREYLQKLLPEIDYVNAKIIFCCNGQYFKALTKCKNVASSYGYVLECVIQGYTHLKVILCIDFRALLYDATVKGRLDLSLETLADEFKGIRVNLGTDVIHHADYLRTIPEVKKGLNNLHKYPLLAADIETLSLNFYETGIETIAFAWDEHNGMAFAVDKDRTKAKSKLVRELLTEFFNTYKGKLIWHNAGYDLKIITYTLYMNDLLDYEGQLKGISILCNKFHDTKILSYLAINSTLGNILNLKSLSHNFMGDYGIDVKDTSLIPVHELLIYNVRDVLATWYVYNKYYPIVNKDNQLNIYNTLYLPSIPMIMNMELTGMCIDMDKVIEAENTLIPLQDKYKNYLKSNPTILKFEKELTKQAYEKDYITRRDKAKHPENIKYKVWDDFIISKFNYNSSTQVAFLLYDFLGFTCHQMTKKGNPSTDAKTLSSLAANIENKKSIKYRIVNSLLELSKIEKILNTYILALKERSILKRDNHYYIHGSFNLTGTVSGRLSASGAINLQTIPSNSTYAKLIKKCFIPPNKNVFMFSDFSSLEDRISALITKDPEKILVYTKGYDGHCYRSYYYWKDKMPDIENTLESINSIENKYPEIRQASKEPTFLLTYGGTYHGLMKNVGMKEADAKAIEKNYHKLYKVSDKWVNNALKKASISGYITVAFGLRVRTPILNITKYSANRMPSKAKAEARTAGNALGQSYCMLTVRAALEFFNRVIKSEYKYDIKLCNTVHDAIYLYSKNTLGCVKWINDNLIECMQWDELEELKHDELKLEAKLEVCRSNWSNPIKINNNASMFKRYIFCIS